MHYIPNLLTLGRIALVPWLVVLLQKQQFGLSLLVFVVAGVSDALDGYIAKRYNARTQLGAILDPLADKALLVSSFVMLSLLDIIPFWLMVVVVFRDLVIIGGFLIMFLLFGAIKMQPLMVSKVNTCLQIAFILLVLTGLAANLDLNLWQDLLAYAVLVTSVWSGLAYVSIWSLKTMEDPSQVKADQ
ncbi:MAG: CDP-alcohol phosphatidyltransferase family protein [Pseudomonadota bacterium]